MSITVVNGPSHESTGNRIVGSFGGALNQILQHKLQNLTREHEDLNKQYTREQQRKGFANIVGEDAANFLINLGPEDQKAALQNISSLMQLQSTPGQAQNGMMQQGGLGSLAQQQSGNQQQLMQQQDSQSDIQQALQKYFGHLTPGQRQQGGFNSLMQQQPTQQEQPAQQMQQQMTPERAKLLEDVFTSPRDKREKQKIEIQQRQAQLKERDSTLKETKKYIDTLKDKEKAAKESDLRLKRMENLIAKGNLPNANLWSFLTQIEEAGPLATGGVGALLGSAIPGLGTAIGAGVGGLVGTLSGPLAGAAKSFIKTGSPDVEEFEKLSADFVKNAKQYFGPRLTDADLKVFMKTLPTLMQTNEGKKKVIENLRSLNELADIEAKAARSIIQRNGGIPPIDIEQLVQDKISKKIDKVAKRFIG